MTKDEKCGWAKMQDIYHNDPEMAEIREYIEKVAEDNPDKKFPEYEEDIGAWATDDLSVEDCD